MSVSQFMSFFISLNIRFPFLNQSLTSRPPAHFLFRHLPDGVGRDLVPVSPQVLDLFVVGPLVREVVRGRDRTAVGVLPTLLEHLGVQLAVDVVDGVVEGQEHQLGRGLGLDSA